MKNFINHFNRLFGMLFALPIVHGCVALQHNEPLDATARFLEIYEAVGFSQERRSFDRLSLSRWCEPVRVFVPVTLRLDTYEVVRENLDWLSRIEGLTIEEVASRETALLVIESPESESARDDLVDTLFPGNSRMRRQMKSANCFFEYRSDSDSCLIGATVVIPSYLPQPLQNHCAAEELIQAMGLPNDASEDPESLFNPTSVAEKAAASDKLMVQLHYHPSLRAGMESEDVLRIARPIIQDLLGKPDPAGQ